MKKHNEREQKWTGVAVPEMTLADDEPPTTHHTTPTPHVDAGLDNDVYTNPRTSPPGALSFSPFFSIYCSRCCPDTPFVHPPLTPPSITTPHSLISQHYLHLLLVLLISQHYLHLLLVLL